MTRQRTSHALCRELSDAHLSVLIEESEDLVFEPAIHCNVLDANGTGGADAMLGCWVGVESTGAVRFGYERWPGPSIEVAPGSELRQIHWISQQEALLVHERHDSRVRRAESIACWLQADGSRQDSVELGVWAQQVLPLGERILLAAFGDQGTAEPPFGGGVVGVDRTGEVLYQNSTIESYGLCRTPDGGALVFTLGMQSADWLSPNGQLNATFKVPPQLSHGHSPSVIEREGKMFVICCSQDRGVAVWEVGSDVAAVVQGLTLAEATPTAAGRYLRLTKGGVHVRRFGLR